MIMVTSTYVRYATSIEFEPCIKLSIATDIKKLLSFEENNNNKILSAPFKGPINLMFC